MKILYLVLSLVIITGLCLGQTTRPVVLTVVGALPQDSLTAKVDAKDSSATSGVPRTYVTPTMLNLRVLKSDSSAVSGTATKYTTPTMMGLRVLRSDSSITTGVVGYVTSTMGALLAPKASPTFSGSITGGVLIRGQRTFAYAANVDTLVVSGIASGDYFVVSPVITTATDTTGFNGLWIKSVTTDTVFVVQTTSAGYVAIKYNWMRLK